MNAMEHKRLLELLCEACEVLGDSTRQGPYTVPTTMQGTRMQHAVSSIRAAIAFTVNH